MSIGNLMRHCADVYRGTKGQGTDQQFKFYKRVFRSVPCFIQPADSKEAFYYQQRGLENTHTIYTSRTDLDLQRNDIFEWNGEQFHIVGIKDGLNLGVYLELAAEQFPENAKRRLDRGEYD